MSSPTSPRSSRNAFARSAFAAASGPVASAGQVRGRGVARARFSIASTGGTTKAVASRAIVKRRASPVSRTEPVTWSVHEYVPAGSGASQSSQFLGVARVSTCPSGNLRLSV